MNVCHIYADPFHRWEVSPNTTNVNLMLDLQEDPVLSVQNVMAEWQSSGPTHQQTNIAIAWSKRVQTPDNLQDNVLSEEDKQIRLMAQWI